MKIPSSGARSWRNGGWRVKGPRTQALGLFGRNLQPLTPSDSGDPLDVRPPAPLPQQRCDPAVAIAAVLDGKRRDVGGQSSFIIGPRRLLALCGTILPENSTSKPLGHAMLGYCMLHTGTATCGAQKFPEAASLRISFSSVRTETTRRRRCFSASSSFRRLTWSPFRPPYSVRYR